MHWGLRSARAAGGPQQEQRTTYKGEQVALQLVGIHTFPLPKEKSINEKENEFFYSLNVHTREAFLPWMEWSLLDSIHSANDAGLHFSALSFLLPV